MSSALLSQALMRLFRGRFTHVNKHGVRRPSWRVALVVFLFPVLCLLAALLFAAETLVYLSWAERVEGTVVQRFDWPGETIFDRGSVNYEPIFTFEARGKSLRASVGSGHSSFNLKVGDTAPVWWNPNGNGNVRIDTWQGLWFLPVILGVIGAMTLAFAFGIWALICALAARRGKVAG